MSSARRVLIMCEPSPVPADVERLVAALRREGATVALHEGVDRNDDLVDAIEQADVVLSWK